MNYLKEINALEAWFECNSLDLPCQLLMYKIYKLANKARWPEWVSIDNLTLMYEMRTKREATIIKWRNKLVQVGRIEFKKGRKGKPSQYRIIPFCTTLKEVKSEVKDENEVKYTTLREVQKEVQIVSPYKHINIKLNTIKEKNIKKIKEHYSDKSSYDLDELLQNGLYIAT